jgi:hypothetical protein
LATSSAITRRSALGRGASTPGFTSISPAEADLLELLRVRGHADRELLAAHQRVVEPRAVEPAEHVQPDRSGTASGSVSAGPLQARIDAGDRDLVGHSSRTGARA